MKDLLLRGLVGAPGLRVILVEATDLARMARMLHGLAPTSAAVFAEALAAGLLLGALQKERTRVNLSLEVDGPLSGVLVDADTEGNIRGRIRRPDVHFPGDPSVGPRAGLGGSGTLSVLRDQGEGRFYRGSVEFVPGTLTDNLRRYFAASEQVATALDVQVHPSGREPLGAVAGIVVQKMPEGSLEALEEVRGASPRAPSGRRWRAAPAARSWPGPWSATTSRCSPVGRSPTSATATGTVPSTPSRRSGRMASARCWPRSGRW